MAEMSPKLANKFTCTGCMVCVDACTFSALKSKWDDDGHLYVECDNRKCTGCGKCEKICPVVGEFSYEREISTSVPYVAWANEDAIRILSSSGGIFAPIAYHTINNGGYVAGAVMDGFSVKHILTNKSEDIVRMQGSKYQQGDSTGVYNAVKEKLIEGKPVFFTGVPCQVAALYAFLGKHGKFESLLTADLACSGFPTSLLLKKFAQEKIGIDVENESQKISVTYRSKNEGWRKSQKISVTYRSKDEDLRRSQNRPGKDYGINNFVYNGFCSGNTQRYSCSNCKFALLNRKADLTLADFWSDKRFREQHYKGVSCVVVHSGKGQTMLTQAGLFIYYQAEWNDFIPYNKLIYNKLTFLKIHPARVFMAWNFKHLSYPVLEKLYGKKIDKSDLIWLPYKLFNFIVFKIRSEKRKKYNSLFLKKLTNGKN
ncbi:MAG: Coenzyme F420 hydrogenase/dehydrogenase, beta subunit C-terminal domain [Prolixibacteraceae bacterium]